MLICNGMLTGVVHAKVISVVGTVSCVSHPLARACVGWHQGSPPPPSDPFRQQQQPRGQQQWQRQLSSGVSFGSHGSRGMSTEVSGSDVAAGATGVGGSAGPLPASPPASQAVKRPAAIQPFSGRSQRLGSRGPSILAGEDNSAALESPGSSAGAVAGMLYLYSDTTK